QLRQQLARPAAGVRGLLGVGCCDVDGRHGIVSFVAVAGIIPASKARTCGQSRGSVTINTSGGSLRRLRRPKSLAEINLARSLAQRDQARGQIDGQNDGRGEANKASSAAFMSLQRPAATPPARVRILGLDPGSLCTGYAVIETGPRVTYVVSGSIRARGA